MNKFLLVLSAPLCALGLLHAEIPAVAFKDITKNFKDPHYSPLMGRVALDSGLIYNLRHFGPFDPKMGKNPDGTERRLYDADVPQDKMMALLITLFPSSAGPLASESTGISNFGKTATIQDVANMLKFAKEVRDAFETNKLLQRDPLMSSGKITNLKRKYQKQLGHFRDVIIDCIRSEYNPLLKQYASKGSVKQQIHKQLPPVEEKRGAFRQTAMQSMFKDIEQDRLTQVEDDRLYPFYTTEQIILAFFVHKFNNKSDIYDLMAALGTDFIRIKEHASNGGATRENIEDVVNKNIWNRTTIDAYPHKSDLDYIFMNTYHDLNAPIPYKNGNNPISNGNCPSIKKDAAGGKLIDATRPTFADCQETAIRQFMNIALYDAENKTFVIPDGVENADLATFYGKQPSSLNANDGSSEMRGAWNLVIGGIQGVLYLRGDQINEVDAGYINLIKAVRSILGQPTDIPLPENKDAVIQELERLLKIMNPALKTIDIQISDFIKQQDELYGNATIKITNAYNQQFQFVLRQLMGHADIQNPNWEEQAITLAPRMPQNDDLFNLVDRRNRKTGLHQLLATLEFSDDLGRIKVVKDFNTHMRWQHIPIINRMMHLTVLDKHNIKQARDAISPIIKEGYCFDSAIDIANMDTDDDFWNMVYELDSDTLKKRVREKGTFILTPNRFDRIQDMLASLKKITVVGAYTEINLSAAIGLESLETGPRSIIKTLILPKSSALKTITINGTITMADLRAVIGLRYLATGDSANIGTLTLPDSPDLTTIHLSGKIATAYIWAAQQDKLSRPEGTKIILMDSPPTVFE